MERLKHTKDMLMALVESQLGNLCNVNTKEFGEVIDMIKDLEEAIYYCTITKAMEKKEEESEHVSYYTEPYSKPYLDRMYNDGYYDNGYDYYKNINSNGNENGTRDKREGRSPLTRKMYMEHKDMHSDKTVKMRDLENYMGELTHDITEMIEGASPEEKQLLQQKIAILAQKIV